MKPAVKGLIRGYNKRKAEIKSRLKRFREIGSAGDEEIFSELCFCLLTPQAKATSCDNAIKRLKEKGLLLKGPADAVRPILKGAVRFHNKKAGYLVGARRTFLKCGLEEEIRAKTAFGARQWLVENVKGLGYKEASHFLRNIGLGRDLAILDVHILKNLKRLGVIRNIPSSLTKNGYLAIEEKMRKFSRKAKIPLDELDLLLWSLETGFVFK